MKLDRNLLQPTERPLYGFGGKQVKAIGKITLSVTFGDQNNSRIEHITVTTWVFMQPKIRAF